MNPSDDPSALLPFAIAGLVVGLALVGGCGYGWYQWGDDRGGGRWSQHVVFTDSIAWAGWRPSAVAGGPDWYLQVRLAGNDRGFLVAAAEVPTRRQARYGGPGPLRKTQSISVLMGKKARLAVDSSLAADAANRTPYLSALAVAGETIVPFRHSATDAPLWRRALLGGLLTLGVLIGIGLLTVSGQHVVVCLRHRRQSPSARGSRRSSD